jgi:hypothetical protein
MAPIESMLVVIISDDDKAAFRFRRTATAHGVNVCATRDCTAADLQAMGRMLAAVVIDLRSPEAAWGLVEPLRRSSMTEEVPVLLRYESRHAMTADLLQSLNQVRAVESERGVEAACGELATLLDGLVAARNTAAVLESGVHAWPGRLGGRFSSSPEVV